MEFAYFFGRIHLKQIRVNRRFVTRLNEVFRGNATLAGSLFLLLLGLVDHEIMDMTVKYYLDDFIKENDIETLVLGCTHYPLIKKSISKIYPELEIFSSSKEVAKAVEMELKARDMLSEKKEGKDEFYASDLSETFVELIEKILGQEKDELKIGFEDLDI